MTLINEHFASGSSVIHRIDPRIKVISAAVFTIILAISQQFETLIAGFFFSFSLVLLAGLNVKEVLKRLFVIIGFLILIWVIVPLTFEGEQLFKIGPFSVMKPGVFLSARITLKSVSILMALMALTATMALSTLGHAMSRLKISGKLVHLFMITIRYIAVIEQEYGRLLRAIKIRGFKPGTNMHTYRTFAYIIGILFVRASSRADRVYQAMRCRGFDGRFISIHEFQTHKRNGVFSALMILIIIFISILEWGHLIEF